MRFPSLPLAATLFVTLVGAACTPSHTTSGAPPATQRAATGDPRVPVQASRPPVLITTTAMAGEPAPASLSEARLTPSSCEAHESVVKARIKKMRAEVDAEFQRWHDEQPACWAEDRRRDAERKASEACALSGNCGLGLSGIGEGGGGRGEGIGLGSIGTIGHGSGTGGSSVPRSATSVSRTNNQVAAVDEADIVKTDGRYVYIVANGALRILEAMNPRVLSVTKFPGDVREMLVEGDRAVVFVGSSVGHPRCKYGYDCTVGGDGTSTRVIVLDITNRGAPKSIRQIELTGSLIASRRIGTTVHTVVADGDTINGDYETWPEDLEVCGTMEPIVVAKFNELKAENEQRIRANTSLPKMVDRGVS
ncbi:MAG: beta-propeller domain-containing protein, partial [Polyangiaceae bacterium]